MHVQSPSTIFVDDVVLLPSPSELDIANKFSFNQIPNQCSSIQGNESTRWIRQLFTYFSPIFVFVLSFKRNEILSQTFCFRHWKLSQKCIQYFLLFWFFIWVHCHLFCLVLAILVRSTDSFLNSDCLKSDEMPKNKWKKKILFRLSLERKSKKFIAQMPQMKSEKFQETFL